MYCNHLNQYPHHEIVVRFHYQQTWDYPFISVSFCLDENGNPRFRQAHLWEFLYLKKILMSVKGLVGIEISLRDVIKATVNNPYPWPEPKSQCVRCINNDLRLMPAR